MQSDVLDFTVSPPSESQIAAMSATDRQTDRESSAEVARLANWATRGPATMPLRLESQHGTQGVWMLVLNRLAQLYDVLFPRFQGPWEKARFFPLLPISFFSLTRP